MIKPLAEGRLGILCVCMCVCYLHNYFVWDRSAREKSIGAGQRPPKPKAKLLTLAYGVSPVLAQPHVHIHLASSFPFLQGFDHTGPESLYTLFFCFEGTSDVSHLVFHEGRLSPPRLPCPSHMPGRTSRDTTCKWLCQSSLNTSSQSPFPLLVIQQKP